MQSCYATYYLICIIIYTCPSTYIHMVHSQPQLLPHLSEVLKVKMEVSEVAGVTVSDWDRFRL